MHRIGVCLYKYPERERGVQDMQDEVLKDVLRQLVFSATWGPPNFAEAFESFGKVKRFITVVVFIYLKYYVFESLENI